MGLPLAIAAIPAAFKAGTGIAQLIQGSQMNPQRPTYDIPSAFNNARNVAVASMLDKRPYEQVVAESLLANNSANTLSFLQNNPNAANVAPGIVGQQNRASLQLAAQNSANNAQNEQRFMANENFYGGLQQEEFQINQMQPYQDQATAKRSLTQSGIQNIYSGVDSLAATFSQSALLDGQYQTDSGLGGFSAEELEAAAKRKRAQQKGTDGSMETISSLPTTESGITPSFPLSGSDALTLPRNPSFAYGTPGINGGYDPYRQQPGGFFGQ